MFQSKAEVLRASFLTFLLSLPGSADIKADHVALYDIFAQTQTPSGDCMYEFDSDVQFYVDLDREETVWGLPEFSTVYGFDAQGALPYISRLKSNLRALIQRHNITQVPSEPPEVTVFPKNPVELGQPNVLICHIDRFFPPVLNVTWLHNGKLVTEGTSETIFLPSTELRNAGATPSCRDHGDCGLCPGPGSGPGGHRHWQCVHRKSSALGPRPLDPRTPVSNSGGDDFLKRTQPWEAALNLSLPPSSVVM
ncbi:RLA class II histocompatibility antigen, DP alpha-1 chain isoform X3 [Arvicola amphibius]|uniref:RLA class II histocompatibility antigen, DP alpha-1 chain isoform X3 n=1 Tax=Arvicola amphibius TaxID=1047088 RepID=UPI0018E31006|nr:RLA class II histocompatibility antigen, DP alpha-1 chain isoform X3 [Arvicola amphibius]